jgi:hypothetical protein
MPSMKNPASLFLSTPPTNESWLRELFHDRVAELEHARATLTQEAELPRQLWAVHGPWRSGKSHFARRLLADVRGDARYHLVEVDANSKGSARAVLVQLFHQLLALLPPLPPRELRRPEHERYVAGRGECYAIKPLAEGLQREVTHEVEARATTSEGTSAAVKVGPQWFQVEMGQRGGVEASSTQKSRVTLTAPTDLDLVEWIRHALDMHALASPRRVLFFVDDCDLVAGDGTEASDYSKVLFTHLHGIAQHPGSVVVLTVRQQSYVGREKEFEELASVHFWEDPEDLLEVYRKHIETFNASEAVFHESALMWLAAGVEGCVGVFLQICREVAQKVPAAERPIDKATLRATLRRQFTGWRQQPELVAITDAVLEAVKKGAMQVDFAAPLPNNPLLQRVLVPILGRDGAYRLSRVYFELLRESPL